MASNRSAHDRLLVLQKRIHRSLQRQATRLLGEMPEAIRRYEREYREDFKRVPRRPPEASKAELIREIRRNAVTLIGDFHTFAQAQRTALRLLREAVHEDEAWYLGLEMISSHRQEALDRFQLGQLSEARFLEEIGYHEEWGFPWAHYAPIIHWAIRHRVKLVALNRPRELRRPVENDHNELQERDLWAAGVITDVFQDARAARVRRPRMVVLYGELHIGRKHLPTEIKRVSGSALKKRLRTLIVHQNQDSLYWKVASQGRELEAEIIRLRQRNYCVLSSPPWAKLQSVINWAEGDSPEMEELDEIDPHSLMKQYAEIVAEFFSLPKPSFDGLDVYTVRNADFAEKLDAVRISAIEKRLLRYHVLHHHRIYIPRAGLAYLASPSENGAAEIASMHLFRSVSCEENTAASAKEQSVAKFYAWILENAFAFLGSLVLNPRRKCDLIGDHETRIKALSRGQPATYPHEREARELAFALLSPSAQLERLNDFLREPRLVSALYFAARYTGFALAKQIHHCLLEEEIDLPELRRIFFGNGESAPAPSFWRFSALRAAALKSPLGTSKTAML